MGLCKVRRFQAGAGLSARGGNPRELRYGGRLTGYGLSTALESTAGGLRVVRALVAA